MSNVAENWDRCWMTLGHCLLGKGPTAAFNTALVVPMRRARDIGSAGQMCLRHDGKVIFEQVAFNMTTLVPQEFGAVQLRQRCSTIDTRRQHCTA